MTLRSILRLVVPVALALALAACKKEPPDLPGGHVAWLDGGGVTRYALRAKPYGYRVLAEGSAPWGRIRRQAGEVRLTGPGGVEVIAQNGPDGPQTTDPAGAVRARVRQTPTGLAILDRAAAPVGQLTPAGGVVTVSNAGGLPIGTVKESGGALVQRGREGNVAGTLLGSTDPLAAALLMLGDLPLEDRLALLAFVTERRQERR